MIKALRKRHLQAWLILSAALPIGIIMAWISIPGTPVNLSTLPPNSTTFPKLMKSIRHAGYTMHLRCSETGENCQLEYIGSQPLTVPSLLIYRMKPGAQTIDEHELLGRIESRGSYAFALPQAEGNEATGFILYDFIHGKVIDTIKL